MTCSPCCVSNVTSPLGPVATTCVRGADGRAIWFSKNIFPAIRSEDKLRKAGPVSPVLQHVGLYGYSREALARIANLPPSRYEELEGLEQLRFLEHGVPIVVTETHDATIGVDTEQDLHAVEARLARLPRRA